MGVAHFAHRKPRRKLDGAVTDNESVRLHFQVGLPGLAYSEEGDTAFHDRASGTACLPISRFCLHCRTGLALLNAWSEKTSYVR